LQRSDVNNQSIPFDSRFYFFGNDQVLFFVYKSLACFLSSEASKCLLSNRTEFQIRIKNVKYNLSVIKDSLVELLTGFPIIIHESNFHIFQKIFESIGNNDFQTRFEGKPPGCEDQFFLSINSLKNIPFGNVEKETFQLTALSGFSIPLGLVHLFWNHPHDFGQTIFGKYNQYQIADF
jgi:hypothetical protein